MNIYLLSQSKNNGYDTYDSCVVIAKDEKQARHIHPQCLNFPKAWKGKKWWNDDYGTWAKPEDVQAILLGKARKELVAGVACHSFNAG